MPFVERGSARLHYQDLGDGPAIVTTHGVCENHLYWTLPGIVDRLVAAGYRVISTDMRGHGRSSVRGEPKGYDVETVAADVDVLADHLGLSGFHLLTHATGGMAGLRYAMSRPARLLSLISTNTGSATIPSDAAAEVADPNADFDSVLQSAPARMSAYFRGRTWHQILQGARAHANHDVFLNRMHSAVDPDAAFGWYERCLRLGDPDTLADFMDSFYTDPNPRIDGLRAIRCSCLVLTGEYDRMFLAPSIQLAREIPNARLVIQEGRGHMSAFENPDRLAAEILGFLEGLDRLAGR